MANAPVNMLKSRVDRDAMFGQAVRERKIMRYFTLITKYPHCGRLAQGGFRIVPSIADRWF
jgi:hypothetical protein